jgi:hypothetical protein
MFKGCDGIRCFLVQMNGHNECVVYPLDDAGRPTGFACGRPEEVIGEALKSSNPYLRVVNIVRSNRVATGGPFSPADFSFDVQPDRWARLAEVLRGRGKAAGAAERWWSFVRYRADVELAQIDPGLRYGDWYATEAGARIDAALDAADAADAAASNGRPAEAEGGADG